MPEQPTPTLHEIEVICEPISHHTGLDAARLLAGCVRVLAKELKIATKRIDELERNQSVRN